MPRNLFRYIIIIFFIIIVSFGYGYLKTFLLLKQPLEYNNVHNKGQDAVIKTSEMKLIKGAKLIYITFYTGCGDEIIEKKDIDEKYIGLTKAELEQNEEDWFIDNFTPNEAILKREQNGICNNHYYVGIKDGYVALFQGIPGFQSTLIEKTSIIVDTLREDDRLILEKGLIINDKQEFLKIREGLTN